MDEKATVYACCECQSFLELWSRWGICNEPKNWEKCGTVYVKPARPRLMMACENLISRVRCECPFEVGGE